MVSASICLMLVVSLGNKDCQQCFSGGPENNKLQRNVMLPLLQYY